MNEIIEKLIEVADRPSNSIMSIHPHAKSLCLEAANRIKYLEEEVKKYKFMIDEGLGWEDMRRDL